MAKSRDKPPELALRGRVWVEVADTAAINEAGADLLEQIDALGSLSEAARRLRFSYRRAWMLLDAMNRRWPTPLVITSAGGRHGGGARLTDDGRALLRTFRDLQIRLEHLLDHSSAGFAKSVGYPTA